MITTTDELWATDTLKNAQDPGAGAQQWKSLTRITLERFNLIFSEAHSRGYPEPDDSRHDAATALENGFATLLKVCVGTASDDAVLTKWSVAAGLEYDDVSIIPGASISDTARPSMEVTAGVALTIRVFFVGESDANIHYRESVDGGANFGAEQAVGAQANLKAIASVSPDKVHCVSYVNGNSRFHFFEDDGGWSETDSLVYWPHEIEDIDAISIGDRDLIVFYSEGPMYGNYREAGIYGIWETHGRWGEIFKIDVLDETTDYSFRKDPMLSTANDIIFLTGYLGEGDSEYGHETRFLKTSKDGQFWSQYQPLVVCGGAGLDKLLVINAASGQSWPFSTGQQCYVVGYDKIYESDATRLVGEENSDLQVDVTSRVSNKPGWTLSRGVISQATMQLGNHDGALDNHSIITDTNTLLILREAGYRTGAGDEYAQLTIEQVDYISETDKLPQRHKKVVSRDLMAWMRDQEADHFEEWKSQLVGYDNYHDDSETAYGGLGHTATQTGWWQTQGDVLWLRSENKEGIAFATWDSQIMNGQVKAGVRIETAGNDEYAGVVFRAKDTGNLWAAYYDQATDKIVLRQKVGGGWQAAVATSAALSWSVDTWYAVMADFRYSYVRVFYSADGLTWSLAFTYVIPQNPSLPANEYGYTGVIGYGYSDQDEDEPPGYEPPTLPPPVTPPGPGAEGAGNTGYFCDGTSGRVFRVTGAKGDDPVYEDLGVVDANGLRYITLDSWNPKNRAMACGDDGVWRTENLDDPIPTWAKVIEGVTVAPNHHDFTMIASSICQYNRWMVVCRYWNQSQNNWFLFVHTSDDFGENWTRVGLHHWGWVLQGNRLPTIEMSSHDPDVAWIVSTIQGAARVTKTDDNWASYSSATVGLSANSPEPCGYHRYFQNDDDQYALYGGKYSGSNLEAMVSWCVTDPTGSTTALLSPGTGAHVFRVGGYTWGTNRYWALSHPTGSYEFHVSDDALTWVRQYVFPGTTKFISGLPREEEFFFATQNGAVAPLLISRDRGLTWQEQEGNWATELGYTGDITCFVPLWTE